ncbi:MAG: hypothetical protein E7156_03805 [Streptococcus gallolyticus]|uniref:Uncharacterized protein n=1 Tax=Streptococcus gallolyticus TaxID=315405 RepID=A0A927XHG4_9STRE|nr:hypothetical protein [Streptococcus gallolyticus]
MKKSGAGKVILIILVIALVVAIAAILMPVALVGGVGAVWYFTKKKPDIKKRNISVAVAAVGLLGTIFITPAIFKDNSNASTTIATSSSSSKTKESSSSSSSEVKTTAESSSKTEQSTEPTTKNDGPEYTKESNAAFATAFMNTLNQALADGGANMSVTVQYYGKNLIYVYVPQSFKYEPTSSIQEFADTVYAKKESYFNEWAIDNGYDLSYTNAPHLYIKSDGDQTTLAEESGILNKTMKVKVKN